MECMRNESERLYKLNVDKDTYTAINEPGRRLGKFVSRSDVRKCTLRVHCCKLTVRGINGCAQAHTL